MEVDSNAAFAILDKLVAEGKMPVKKYVFDVVMVTQGRNGSVISMTTCTMRYVDLWKENVVYYQLQRL